jgi:hypothetical protein
MKAFLIAADTQTVEAIEITDLADIQSQIGVDTIISDPIGTNGDRLFFDEECFLRGTAGRFKIDALVPVAGRAVVIGASADGETLSDVTTDLADLRARITYL